MNGQSKVVFILELFILLKFTHKKLKDLPKLFNNLLNFDSYTIEFLLILFPRSKKLLFILQKIQCDYCLKQVVCRQFSHIFIPIER